MEGNDLQYERITSLFNTKKARFMTVSSVRSGSMSALFKITSPAGPGMGWVLTYLWNKRIVFEVREIC